VEKKNKNEKMISKWFENDMNSPLE
jgi:hypothetical protein